MIRGATTIAVGTLDELKRLVRDWRHPTAEGATFQLDFAPPGPLRRRWERELAVRYSDCGCVGGVVGAIAATTGYMAAVYLVRWLPAPTGLNGLFWCGGAFVIGSVIGKAIGLGNARLRLSVMIQRIERGVA